MPRHRRVRYTAISSQGTGGGRGAGPRSSSPLQAWTHAPSGRYTSTPVAPSSHTGATSIESPNWYCRG